MVQEDSSHLADDRPRSRCADERGELYGLFVHDEFSFLSPLGAMAFDAGQCLWSYALMLFSFRHPLCRGGASLL
jgi:hypothetical protein